MSEVKLTGPTPVAGLADDGLKVTFGASGTGLFFRQVAFR